MKNFTFILFFLFIGSIFSFSQATFFRSIWDTSPFGVFIDYDNPNLTVYEIENALDTKFEGSKFFTSEFVSTKFSLVNGMAFDGVANFDLYKNKLVLVDKKGKALEVLNDDRIIHFKLNNTDFLKLRDIEGKQYKQFYAVDAYVGNHLLVSKLSKTIIPSIGAAPYKTPEPPKFSEIKKQYFIYNKNTKELKELGSNNLHIKKSLSKDFNLSKAQLKQIKERFNTSFDFDNKQFSKAVIQLIDQNS